MLGLSNNFGRINTVYRTLKLTTNYNQIINHNTSSLILTCQNFEIGQSSYLGVCFANLKYLLTLLITTAFKPTVWLYFLCFTHSWIKICRAPDIVTTGPLFFSRISHLLFWVVTMKTPNKIWLHWFQMQTVLFIFLLIYNFYKLDSTSDSLLEDLWEVRTARSTSGSS